MFSTFPAQSEKQECVSSWQSSFTGDFGLFCPEDSASWGAAGAFRSLHNEGLKLIGVFFSQHAVTAQLPLFN